MSVLIGGAIATFEPWAPRQLAAIRLAVTTGVGCAQGDGERIGEIRA